MGKEELAKAKVLAFFTEQSKAKLKAKGGQPVMKLVMGKRGPKLKTYVGEGTRRLTGMHILRSGGIHVIGGDMLKERDRYFTSEVSTRSGKQRRSSGEVQIMDYILSTAVADVLGRKSEIEDWFDENDSKYMVVPKEDDYELDTDDSPTQFSAGVRIIAWGKQGDKDYVNLGGLATGSIEALKQAFGVFTGGIGDAFGNALTDLVGSAPDIAEIAEGLIEKGFKAKPGETGFDRDLAEGFLELAVSLHEGPSLVNGEFTASHTWDIEEREIVDDRGDAHSWPVISLHKVRHRVVNQLIPSVFDQLEDAIS